MVLFLLSVQVLWAKLVRKQVDLSTNMMWPLMFVCLQCSHKPKSSIPRWVYPIASLQFQLSQPLDFLSNFNQSTEGMKFWFCFCCQTASHRNHRCMCGRWNSELSEQERCAVSFACSSCWSPKMVYMQQVIPLSSLRQHVQELTELNLVFYLASLHMRMSFSVAISSLGQNLSFFQHFISTLLNVFPQQLCLLLTWMLCYMIMIYPSVSWIMSCVTWRYQQSRLWGS